MVERFGSDTGLAEWIEGPAAGDEGEHVNTFVAIQVVVPEEALQPLRLSSRPERDT